MKNIFLLLILLSTAALLQAQSVSQKKQPTIGLHFFYNDFATPVLLKANGLGSVISNKQWSQPQNMEGGFGVDYLQGIIAKIDAVGSFNASWVNYLKPGNILYGSSNFLLDVNAGIHIKLLTDKHTFSPFIIGKAGYTNYKNINGFSIYTGAGVQANLFKDAFILATTEYRIKLSNSLSNQLYYSIGIATSLPKKTKKQPIPTIEKKTEPEIVKKPEAKKETEQLVQKNILVNVLDEATAKPLQYVDVLLKSNDGNEYHAVSNEDGKAIFNQIKAGEYTISGRLNKIDATTTSITTNDFAIATNQIIKDITHNDPRFTLVGNTIELATKQGVGGTQVTITNQTQSSTAFANSQAGSGEFRSQLESESDFSIVGKKASYISNIENLSTKGLNRSATLYVKLQLGIQQAAAGKTIILNKIFFETGKATLNTSASSDVIKLIQFLKDNPTTKLEIQGHTDNVGNLVANNKLSQLRANSVVNYLVKNGIALQRLIAKGYGPLMPIAENITKEGKAQNRRVEMKVIE